MSFNVLNSDFRLEYVVQSNNDSQVSPKQDNAGRKQRHLSQVPVTAYNLRDESLIPLPDIERT